MIETVARATSVIGSEPIVPVPDGASADSTTILAARESERQPPRPRGASACAATWARLVSKLQNRRCSIPGAGGVNLEKIGPPHVFIVEAAS